MEAIARTKYGVEDANKVLEKAGKPDLEFYDAANKNKYLVDQDGLWSSAAATNYMSTALAQYTESNKNMAQYLLFKQQATTRMAKRLFLYSVLMQQTQLNQLSSQAQ